MIKKLIFLLGAIALAVVSVALISQTYPVKTSLLDSPKPYFQTDRAIHAAILSQKKTEVADLDRNNLQKATASLFAKLKADQKYDQIIVVYDPSYPATDPDILIEQARHDFPSAKLQSLIVQTTDTEITLYDQVKAAGNLDATLVVVHSYLNYTDQIPELADFEKAHYQNVYDHLDKKAINTIPYTNSEAIKALYQIAKEQNSLKSLPTLADNTFQYQIQFLAEGSGAKTQVAHLVFFGDMMLGRHVRVLMDANKSLDYPFAKLDHAYLQSNDLLIANLEGPIAEKAIATSKSIAFRFLPDIAPLLQRHYFDALSQANNHAFDMGKQGFADTTKYLQNNNIVPFGNARELSDLSVAKFDLNGQKVALLGLNHTDFKLDKPAVIAKIKSLGEEGYQVFPYIHWGIEYQHTPTTEQIELAHSFVDAGAKAVIGMHPHVVESIEIYNNAPIFYSLGNTVFDQYFSPDTQEGLTLAMELSPQKMTILLLPISIRQSQPELMNPDQRTAFLQKLAGWWRYDQEIKDQIEKGKIVINLAKN